MEPRVWPDELRVNVWQLDGHLDGVYMHHRTMGQRHNRRLQHHVPRDNKPLRNVDQHHENGDPSRLPLMGQHRHAEFFTT